VLLGLPNTVLEVLDGPTADRAGLLMVTADSGDPVTGHTESGAVAARMGYPHR
jgi:hypothetical protein